MFKPLKHYNIVKCLVLAFCMLAFVPSATAQITRTARIELTHATQSVTLGPDIYITNDMELTEQIVASRHENNLRGVRQDSDVINLGLAPGPVWIIFSVTNNSSHEDWVLDFGSVSQGRMGFIQKLLVKNHTRDEIFIRSMRNEGAKDIAPENIGGTAVPIKIGIGKTELLVAYVEAEDSIPATFAPLLKTSQYHLKSLGFFDLFMIGMVTALIAAAAFSGAAAYLERTLSTVLFSAYYLGHLILLLFVQAIFFVTFSFAGDLVALLFPLSFLFGLMASWKFLDITIEDYSDNALILSVGSFVVVSALIAMVIPGTSVFDEALLYLPSALGNFVLAFLAFSFGQRGKMPAYFLACGWIISFIGIFITILSTIGILSSSRFLLNGYWLSLLPQSLFFMAAVAKKIQIRRAEERASLSRESRAAQSLARLKQSKENADQARLLRVIERERELMAELREQEMQRTEEMRRAKEAADHANRAKSAFLAVVSHEIRTPMTGIMGILRLLKDTKLSREQSEYLLTIQKSSDTMMTLLNDILDFEKIETGNMEMEDIDFDLPKLVQGVVTLMSGHAADRNVTLKSNIPHNFPAVLKGDPTRLRQVLLNLVNNAIKFTENGSVTIHLRASKLDDKYAGVRGDYEIYFGVEDTGIGISEAAQEKIFTPFEQADNSVSRKYGGTGLGLAICKRLIAAMGGSIGVTSQTGVGSTFYFSLLMRLGDKAQTAEAESPSTAYVKDQTPPMSILVIEDNEINRKVLRNFLEKDGHQVIMTESAENGLEIFAREEFDAIFTDINLRGMSGLEAARIIRSFPNARKAQTPIVAITGNVADEDIQSFYKAGMNGFIGKPIDHDKLMALLADISFYAHRTIFNTPVRIAEAVINEEPERIAEAPVETAPEPDNTGEAVDLSTVFDMKMLDGLLRSLGKEQMKELLDGFIDKTDEIVTALVEAAQANDKNLIYERAHELKGMAANFGMKELAKIGGIAEKSAKDHRLEQAAAEIEKLPHAAIQMKNAIRQWLR